MDVQARIHVSGKVSGFDSLTHLHVASTPGFCVAHGLSSGPPGVGDVRGLCCWQKIFWMIGWLEEEQRGQMLAYLVRCMSIGPLDLIFIIRSPRSNFIDIHVEGLWNGLKDTILEAKQW